MSSLPSCLHLGVTDAVPIPLTFKYTFRHGELDEERLCDAIEVLLDGDYWPLRGVLHGLSITLSPPYPPVLDIVHRQDLTLADIAEDAILTDGLAYEALLDHCAVLKVRVTRLLDGHLVGVNISHAYADAHTFFRLFFPALAAAYSGREIPHRALNDRSPLILSPSPSHSLTGQLGPHYIVMSAAQQPMPTKKEGCPEKVAGRRSNRVLLSLSPSSINTIREIARSHTRLAAVYATIWKALGVRHLIFPCNVRDSPTRWQPVIPYEYAGNAVFVHGAFCDTVTDATLSDLAKRFENATAECTSERNKELAMWMAEVTKDPRDGVFVTVPMDDDSVAVTSWTHCELAPLFGGIRPQCVWSWAEYPRHLLSITDGSGGGLDIHGHPDEISLIQSYLLSSLQVEAHLFS
jgi:hypothetical protein